MRTQFRERHKEEISEFTKHIDRIIDAYWGWKTPWWSLSNIEIYDGPEWHDLTEEAKSCVWFVLNLDYESADQNCRHQIICACLEDGSVMTENEFFNEKQEIIP